ncbi:hypothetical protein Emed_005451 [Eimeria media]
MAHRGPADGLLLLQLRQDDLRRLCCCSVQCKDCARPRLEAGNLAVGNTAAAAAAAAHQQQQQQHRSSRESTFCSCVNFRHPSGCRVGLLSWRPACHCSLEALLVIVLANGFTGPLLL